MCYFLRSNELMVIGEEMGANGALQEARKDIRDKLWVWNPVIFLGYDFFFVYFAGGCHLQFVVVPHRRETVILQELGGKLILSRSEDRGRAVKILVNMFRVIVFLNQALPVVPPRA